RRQALTFAQPSGKRRGELLQPRGSESSPEIEQRALVLLQLHHLWGPIGKNPTSTDWECEEVAHAIFHVQLDRPPINPDGLQRFHHLRDGKGGKGETCGHVAGCRRSCRELYPFLPPSLRGALVQEDRLAND